MTLPGPLRDRERQLLDWATVTALLESHHAIMDEVSHMIEDICEVPRWRPFKKRRLRREMNLAYRLMEAFKTASHENDRPPGPLHVA